MIAGVKISEIIAILYVICLMIVFMFSISIMCEEVEKDNKDTQMNWSKFIIFALIFSALVSLMFPFVYLVLIAVFLDEISDENY